MKVFVLSIALLITTGAWAQSGVGGGGQTNVSGGGAASPGSPGTVGGGASPIMAVYFSPQCPVANTGNCFNTPADTQQSQACSWTAATPSTVTCGSQLTLISGSVTANVATYSTNTNVQNSIVPSNWVAGNTVVITNFASGDVFLNQTCTITSTTASTIVCPLTHANASSGTSNGIITNTSVGPFVSGDVGKQVAGWQNCAAFANNTVMGANAITTNGAPLVTSFISATQVQITTAANAQAAQTGCFIWGHPDDAAATTAENAYVNFSFCPRLELAASNYMFTKPHFYNNPIACNQEGTAWPAGAGNVFYSAGFDLQGRGNGATNIYLMPNFPNGDPCNRGLNLRACFVIPLMGRWRDFQITGGSQPVTNMSGYPKALISAEVATVNNITCTNFGGYLPVASTFYGFEAGWQMQFDQFNNSGCGNVGLEILTGQGGVTARWLAIENSLSADVSDDGPGAGGNLSANFTCYDCKFFASESNATSTASGGIYNFGGWVALYRATFSSGLGLGSGSTLNAYQGLTSGSILQARDSVFFLTTGVSSSSIVCTAACTNYLSNTKLSAAGTGKTYSDFAGSFLYDQCGNGLNVSLMTISGSIVGSCSIAGAFLTTGGVGLTSGWGTSSVASVTAGSDSHAGSFTITGAAGSANPTLTLTFPVAYAVAPSSCTLSFGSAGATTDFSNVFASTPSATAVVFNLIGTPTAVSIVFDYRCGP